MHYFSKFLILHSFNVYWASFLDVDAGMWIKWSEILEPLLWISSVVFHMIHGRSISNVSRPFAIGWSDRSECLFIVRKQLGHLCIARRERKNCRGFLFVIGRNSEMLGRRKLCQRFRALLSLSENWLSFIHKDSGGGSEIPLLISQSMAFYTEHFMMPTDSFQRGTGN